MILTDFEGFLKGAAIAAVASLGLVMAQPAAARDAVVVGAAPMRPVIGMQVGKGQKTDRHEHAAETCQEHDLQALQDCDGGASRVRLINRKE